MDIRPEPLRNAVTVGYESFARCFKFPPPGIVLKWDNSPYTDDKPFFFITNESAARAALVCSPFICANILHVDANNATGPVENQREATVR